MPGIYLQEEVIAEQLVRNQPPFRRFLEVAGTAHTEILNYSNIAKDILADAKTVSSYFDILEDTLIGFRLPSYHKSVRKRQKSAPKFYFFDSGVARVLSGRINDPLPAKTFEYGQQFESFVINEIFRVLSYREVQFRLSCVRVDEKQEIDLVIERGQKPVAICEIKSCEFVDERMTENLRVLGNAFTGATKFVISNDPEPKSFGDIMAYHWVVAIHEIIRLFG